MTTTTETGGIVLHAVPGDDLQQQIASATREATYELYQATYGLLNLGEILPVVASRLGISATDAAAAVGLSYDAANEYGVVPDGIRACYRSQCTHSGGDQSRPANLDEAN